MANPMVVGAVIAGFGAAIKGVSGGIRSRKEREALEKQAEQMRQLVESMKGAVRDGKMTLNDMLGRIDAHVSDMGGQIKQAYDNQMQIGTQLIQSNLKSALDHVKFNLNEAKITADQQTRDVIDQKEQQVDNLSREFGEANQELANQATRNRLSASGFFAAALNKSQETLGKAVNELEKTASRSIRSIGEQLAGVSRSGIFQTGQSQAQADRSALGLEAQVGGRRSQREQQLAQFGYGAREQSYANALNQKMNELAIQQQGKGFNIMAASVDPWPEIFDAIGGTAIGIGTGAFNADAMGASLSN